ncbi:DUF3135 domain-containing protein [Sedimenticola sp.]|uniref:DUF3135 domain-containing protein n=1 Tax=Sedimenticola sp. TaxID=1940285 RepID=UPI003D0D711F
MEQTDDRLDFDKWLKLASTDLSAFEALRRAKINEVIEQAPKEQHDRLRRLQWRIDQERRRCENPMGACIRLSRMMWEQMMGEGGLVERLHSLSREHYSAKLKRTRSAKVIPLVPGSGARH